MLSYLFSYRWERHGGFHGHHGKRRSREYRNDRASAEHASFLELLDSEPGTRGACLDDGKQQQQCDADKLQHDIRGDELDERRFPGGQLLGEIGNQ